MVKTIVVVDYDPNWPQVFEQLRSRIWPAVRDIATAIHHVGSTAVPGLAAKPIVDMSVEVPAPGDVSAGIARLAGLGYVHRGNLGVEGREAFRAPAVLPAHHLYLCPSNSLALRNQLAVRDVLRADPQTAEEYGVLKSRLAVRFAHDSDGYVAGKTETILSILRRSGFRPDELATIAAINRRTI
jgi:GrpB-like predicted nucleotidyltransferase (UPF0157 family)